MTFRVLSCLLTLTLLLSLMLLTLHVFAATASQPTPTTPGEVSTRIKQLKTYLSTLPA